MEISEWQNTENDYKLGREMFGSKRLLFIYVSRQHFYGKFTFKQHLNGKT